MSLESLVMEIIVAVSKFSRSMDERLMDQGNLQKGLSWRKMTLQELLIRLGEEERELLKCLKNRGTHTNAEIQREILDVANFCMFLYEWVERGRQP